MRLCGSAMSDGESTRRFRAIRGRPARGLATAHREAPGRITFWPRMPQVSFGIATAPQNVDYADILRVWRDADTVSELTHAWLFDHLMPIASDRLGPIFEGWTLLAALAAQTSRLRLGLLVTSNRLRPPAMLAKIATTVDVVSDGRMDFGIGAGSRTSIPEARREYDAYGLPYLDISRLGRRARRSLPGDQAAVDRDRAV
jgi:Luciferase-like monooxygenase